MLQTLAPMPRAAAAALPSPQEMLTMARQTRQKTSESVLLPVLACSHPQPVTSRPRPGGAPPPWTSPDSTPTSYLVRLRAVRLGRGRCRHGDHEARRADPRPPPGPRGAPARRHVRQLRDRASGCRRTDAGGARRGSVRRRGRHRPGWPWEAAVAEVGALLDAGPAGGRRAGEAPGQRRRRTWRSPTGSFSCPAARGRPHKQRGRRPARPHPEEPSCITPSRSISGSASGAAAKPWPGLSGPTWRARGQLIRGRHAGTSRPADQPPPAAAALVRQRGLRCDRAVGDVDAEGAGIEFCRGRSR